MTLLVLALSTSAHAWTIDGPDFRYAAPGDVDAPAFVFTDISGSGTVLATISNCDDCAELVGGLLPPGTVFMGPTPEDSSNVSAATNGGFFAGPSSIGSFSDIDPGDDPSDLIYFQMFGDIAVLQYENNSFFPGPSTGNVRMQILWDTASGGMSVIVDDWQGGVSTTPGIGPFFVSGFSPSSGDTYCMVQPGVAECPSIVGGPPGGDFVADTVEGTAGFADTIDSGPAQFSSQTIDGNVADAMAAFTDAGCTGMQQIAGTWSRRRSPRVQGATEGGGTITGPSLLSVDIDGTSYTSSLGSGGTFSGSAGDMMIMGNFAKLNNAKSIWYGVEADCSPLP